MKATHSLVALAASLLFALTTGAYAQAPSPQRVLTLVFVDSLHGNSSDLNNYDRVVRVFKEVLENGEHPVSVQAERFASNTPTHETELRIFFQGIRKENYEEITFAAWMTLNDHGAKEDLGVIRYRYSIRPGEPMDDCLDKAVRGAAKIAASKIADFLFPKAGEPKAKS